MNLELIKLFNSNGFYFNELCDVSALHTSWCNGSVTWYMFCETRATL